MTDNPTILFISHKRKDNSDLFEQLKKHLRNHYREDAIYIDLDSNKTGFKWEHQQQDALEACSLLLEVVSTQWQPTKWIIHELATAFEREIPVIPVLLDHDLHNRPPDSCHSSGKPLRHPSSMQR